MLRLWTEAAARLCAGKPAQPLRQDAPGRAADSGDALGLSAARLSLTFGFGARLFVKGDADRYGLAARRPPALVDLPEFEGDELAEPLTGGDLSVQACADDPQVAFHTVRQLAALGRGVAALRWAQTGFLPDSAPGQRPTSAGSPGPASRCSCPG